MCGAGLAEPLAVPEEASVAAPRAGGVEVEDAWEVLAVVRGLVGAGADLASGGGVAEQGIVLAKRGRVGAVLDLAGGGAEGTI